MENKKIINEINKKPTLDIKYKISSVLFNSSEKNMLTNRERYFGENSSLNTENYFYINTIWKTNLSNNKSNEINESKENLIYITFTNSNKYTVKLYFYGFFDNFPAFLIFFYKNKFDYESEILNLELIKVVQYEVKQKGININETNKLQIDYSINIILDQYLLINVGGFYLALLSFSDFKNFKNKVLYYNEKNEKSLQILNFVNETVSLENEKRIDNSERIYAIILIKDYENKNIRFGYFILDKSIFDKHFLGFKPIYINQDYLTKIDEKYTVQIAKMNNKDNFKKYYLIFLLTINNTIFLTITSWIENLSLESVLRVIFFDKNEKDTDDYDKCELKSNGIAFNFFKKTIKIESLKNSQILLKINNSLDCQMMILVNDNLYLSNFAYEDEPDIVRIKLFALMKDILKDNIKDKKILNDDNSKNTQNGSYHSTTEIKGKANSKICIKESTIKTSDSDDKKNNKDSKKNKENNTTEKNFIINTIGKYCILLYKNKIRIYYLAYQLYLEKKELPNNIITMQEYIYENKGYIYEYNEINFENEEKIGIFEINDITSCFIVTSNKIFKVLALPKLKKLFEIPPNIYIIFKDDTLYYKMKVIEEIKKQIKNAETQDDKENKKSQVLIEKIFPNYSCHYLPLIKHYYQNLNIINKQFQKDDIKEYKTSEQTTNTNPSNQPNETDPKKLFSCIGNYIHTSEKVCELCSREGVLECKKCHNKYYCCDNHYFYDFKHNHFIECEFYCAIKEIVDKLAPNSNFCKKDKQKFIFNRIFKFVENTLKIIFIMFKNKMDYFYYSIFIKYLIMILKNFSIEENIEEFLWENRDENFTQNEWYNFYLQSIFYVNLHFLQCKFLLNIGIKNIADCYNQELKNNLLMKLLKRSSGSLIHFSIYKQGSSDLTKGNYLDLISNIILLYSCSIKYKIKLYSDINFDEIFNNIIDAYKSSKNSVINNKSKFFMYFLFMNGLSYFLVETGNILNAISKLTMCTLQKNLDSYKELRFIILYNLGLISYAKGDFKFGIHYIEAAYEYIYEKDSTLRSNSILIVMETLGFAYLNTKYLYKAYIIFKSLYEKYDNLVSEERQQQKKKVSLYIRFIFELYRYIYIDQKKDSYEYMNLLNKSTNKINYVQDIIDYVDKGIQSNEYSEFNIKDMVEVAKMFACLGDNVYDILNADQTKEIVEKHEVYKEAQNQKGGLQSQILSGISSISKINTKRTEDKELVLYSNQITLKMDFFEALNKTMQNNYQNLNPTYFTREVALRDPYGVFSKFNVNYHCVYSQQFVKEVEKIKKDFAKKLYTYFASSDNNEYLVNRKEGCYLFSLSEFMKDFYNYKTVSNIKIETLLRESIKLAIKNKRELQKKKADDTSNSSGTKNWCNSPKKDIKNKNQLISKNEDNKKESNANDHALKLVFKNNAERLIYQTLYEIDFHHCFVRKKLEISIDVQSFRVAKSETPTIVIPVTKKKPKKLKIMQLYPSNKKSNDTKYNFFRKKEDYEYVPEDVPDYVNENEPTYVPEKYKNQRVLRKRNCLYKYFFDDLVDTTKNSKQKSVEKINSDDINNFDKIFNNTFLNKNNYLQNFSKNNQKNKLRNPNINKIKQKSNYLYNDSNQLQSYQNTNNFFKEKENKNNNIIIENNYSNIKGEINNKNVIKTNWQNTNKFIKTDEQYTKTGYYQTSTRNKTNINHTNLNSNSVLYSFNNTFYKKDRNSSLNNKINTVEYSCDMPQFSTKKYNNYRCNSVENYSNINFVEDTVYKRRNIKKGHLKSNSLDKYCIIDEENNYKNINEQYEINHTVKPEKTKNNSCKKFTMNAFVLNQSIKNTNSCLKFKNSSLKRNVSIPKSMNTTISSMGSFDFKISKPKHYY